MKGMAPSIIGRQKIEHVWINALEKSSQQNAWCHVSAQRNSVMHKQQQRQGVKNHDFSG
jgi:hypothetical protein